jgi:hypothetical protein
MGETVNREKTKKTSFFKGVKSEFKRLLGQTQEPLENNH